MEVFFLRNNFSLCSGISFSVLVRLDYTRVHESGYKGVLYVARTKRNGVP